jgi:hypothetical protein
MGRGWIAIFILLCFGAACLAQEVEIEPPRNAVAGSTLSIPTAGGGDATFYVIGPGTTLKRKISLGKQVDLTGKDLAASGRYVAIVCTGTCRSASFFVAPAAVSSISFLAHPSRASVKRQDAISGVAFPFDGFRNMVLAPATVSFQMRTNHDVVFSREVPTRMGVAWFRTDSSGRAGTANLTASVKDVSEQRVLQLVASDPCNLRIQARQTAEGILAETEPVHDCSGNVVPDGTIVSFTASSADGRSTVDAPIKKGIARAQLAGSGATVISAASGVVMGNEVRMDVKR